MAEVWEGAEGEQSRVRSEVREIIGDKIIHLKDCGFYSECNTESLKGFEQGMI